jgi:uncharacterized protein
VRAAAEGDPRGFLAAPPRPAIFDEIQCAPSLPPYIKELVDDDRRRACRFLLTGSQNLAMSAAVTESLAGRAAVLRLLPLSWREIAGQPRRPLPWERRSPGAVGPALPPGDLWARFLRGCYPDPVARPRLDGELWHASYVQTYLERDVGSLRQVGDLVDFQGLDGGPAGRGSRPPDSRRGEVVGDTEGTDGRRPGGVSARPR